MAGFENKWNCRKAQEEHLSRPATSSRARPYSAENLTGLIGRSSYNEAARDCLQGTGPTERGSEGRRGPRSSLKGEEKNAVSAALSRNSD